MDKTRPSGRQAYRILLVDDEPHILEIFRNYLSYSGFDVITATDGEEALAQVKRGRPDLLVLDIGMPKMDGWEVCQRLKDSPETCGLPIIFFTAFDQAADHERARALCVQGYIAKPCEPARMVEEVRRCLSAVLAEKNA